MVVMQSLDFFTHGMTPMSRLGDCFKAFRFLNGKQRVMQSGRRNYKKIKNDYQLLKPKIPAIDVISSWSGSFKSSGEVLCLKR